MRDVLAKMEARVPRWGLTSSNARALKEEISEILVTYDVD